MHKLAASMSKSAASMFKLADKSRDWSKVMLLGELPSFPRDKNELKDILFPTQPTGKLPVTEQIYTLWKGAHPEVANEFLVRGDGSRFCLMVIQILLENIVVDSELDVTSFSGLNMKKFFRELDEVSPHSFSPKVLLNREEKSVTGSTAKGTRPDTLVMASGCTFLVGEDKKSCPRDALEDVCEKVQPLSQVFYGPVRFMLGYTAANTEFQWLYINHNTVVDQVSSPLDLSLHAHRSKFLLSLGYAYKLIKKMAESVPNLPGRRAMFQREMNSTGDRILDWSYNNVTKTIIDFSSNLKASVGTSLKLIKQAYEVGKKCKFLAEVVEQPMLKRDKYIVKITPLGCAVKLEDERDGKKFAQHVCQALSVLHKKGLVHRDVRLPNIVKVLEPCGEEYNFMLIDLETVASSRFRLPRGSDHFRSWTADTLEGSKYTPRSDMHHLGKILDKEIGPFVSPLAKEFIKELIEKKLDAETALVHHWLTPVGPF